MKRISNIIKALATTLFLMANPYLCGMECIDDHNKAMESLLYNMNDFNYHLLRDKALKLVYAGADPAARKDISFLRRAIEHNDLETTKILLVNQANPYHKAYGRREPDFFSINTVEMAQLFATHGVNLNAPGTSENPNILYPTILHYPSSKLVKFYLDNKVDTTALEADGSCLLHRLIDCTFNAKDVDDYVKIGQLLLDANPTLITICNKNGEAPINYIQKRIKNQSNPFGTKCIIYEKLFTLFEQYAHNTYNQQPIRVVQHDKTNKFLTLPNELLTYILSQSIDTSKPLNASGPLALLLSTVCKKLNAIELIAILGKSCQCYSYDEKNTALEKLLRSMNDYSYYQKRRAALLLILAGANNAAHKNYSLLQRSVHREDTEMADAILANKADPHQRESSVDVPDFFYSKTITMVQIFIKHGVNLNAPGNDNHPNILYSTILHYPSSKLVQFYIDNNVDTKAICESNGNCILHDLAFGACNAKNGIDDYVQIGKILLHENPELINMINKNGETPLDYAQKELTQYHKRWYIGRDEYKIYEKLIALFKQHGGKTALQLKQLENNDNKKQHDCIICFETSDKALNIPCPNGHPDPICTECLQALSNCPLCNAILKK